MGFQKMILAFCKFKYYGGVIIEKNVYLYRWKVTLSLVGKNIIPKIAKGISALCLSMKQNHNEVV